MLEASSPFEQMDLSGTKPTSVPMETIHVDIDPDVMVADYARAFVREIRRLNPRRFEQAPISDEEMIKYCTYLLYQRVLSVVDECKHWRLLKNLWIPVFIQYAMRMVGRVEIKSQGLLLMPVMSSEVSMSLEEALELSSRIGLYDQDVQMVRDAMPRGKDGDLDTMSCSLIAGYVRSMKQVEHPVATYMAAFLGFKLQEEQAFEVLYRVQYDDLAFLQAALVADPVVMGRRSV